MRLTVVLLALSFLVLAAEPAAVMAGAQEYSPAYSQDYPPVSDGYSASEAYQSGSEEYQSVSQEYPEIFREHAAPQEYPPILWEYQPEAEEYLEISREYQSISEEYVIPQANALTDEEYPDVSRKYQLMSEDYAALQEYPPTQEVYQLKSEEYAMPQKYPSISEGHPMISGEYQPISEEYPRISQEYQSISRKYLSVSGEYAMPEAPPASDVQGSSLTMQRAQSLESLVPLVNAMPALLISGIGLCASVILACLSPISGFLGFLFAPALCAVGALIGAVAGTFASPPVTSLVCGASSLSLGATIDSCIALLCSECFAVCCGGNVVTCVVPWLFTLIWLAFSWSWISAGGFGLGMVIFLIIAAIALIIIGPVSACCSTVPLVGWIGNAVWLMISVLIFGVVMVAFFIIFDLLWSLLVPVIDLIIGAVLLAVSIGEAIVAGTVGIGLVLLVLTVIGFIFGTIPTTLIDITMGCIYLCFDIVCYMPISFCMYGASLCIAIPGTFIGWIVQCVAALPVSAVAGLFSGVACALPPSIAGFISGFIPVVGQVIGCLAGGCGGGVLGCLVGLPVFPVITLVAAVMSACVSLLALASYVAERTRTSDVLLGVLGSLESFVTGITSALTESARTIIGHLLPVLARFAGPLLKLLDVCIRITSVYKDIAPLFFALWYVVYALCASTGILSCCVGPCIAVPGMVCNFCVQVLWAFLVDQHLGGRAPALILEVLRESIR